MATEKNTWALFRLKPPDPQWEKRRGRIVEKLKDEKTNRSAEPGTCGAWKDDVDGQHICTRDAGHEGNHMDDSEFVWWDRCRECDTGVRVNRGWCARCYVNNKC